MSPLNPIYKPVISLDDDPQASPRPRALTVILSFTTFIFALLSLYLSQRPPGLCITSNFHSILSILNLQKGYDTEWEPPKSAIEVQKVIYTSAFRYNETSDSYYRDFDPEQLQYVGEPSPKIDHEWMRLLKKQYVVLTEEEAMQLDDPVTADSKGRYLGEVEVMHSLHCLNAMRKEIHRDYYKDHDMHPLPDDIRTVHVGTLLRSRSKETDLEVKDHCIEQLRQNIQCAGDLTPVLLRPYGKAPNINLIGTPQVHTCRNWDAFRHWWTERANKTGSLSGGGT